VIVRKVLITGVTGQDGSLLASKLLGFGFQVVGTFRRNSAGNFWRLEALGILNKVELIEYSIGDNSLQFSEIFKRKFDYIFHLAGDSFTQDSFRHPFKTLETNISGSLEVIENTLKFSRDSKIFIASSSEIYGNQRNSQIMVDEDSTCRPVNPYGVSHLAILNLVRIYRETSSLFLTSGILFNHESEFRGPQFLTRKISMGLAKIKSGSLDSIKIGNFDSSRDWGSAHEFINVFLSLLESSEPNDFIIATGKITSVRELIVMCCDFYGFEPEFQGAGSKEICIDKKNGNTLFEISEEFYRLSDTPGLIGSTQKLRKHLGWSPQCSIDQVMEKMCQFDYARLEKST